MISHVTVPRCASLEATIRGAVSLAALTLAIGVAGRVGPEVAQAKPGAVGAAIPALALTPAADERLVYPAKPNVCGTGEGIVIRAADGTTTYMSRSHSVEVHRAWEEGDSPCESGVVVVELWGPPGARADVRVAVVDWARITDRTGDPPAGWVSADEAAGRLLSEARQSQGRMARRLVMAAALADAEVWPGLLELGRDRGLPDRTRKEALYWLARQAAEQAAAALGGIVRDPTEADEVRDAAVFALSQLPADRAVPLLIEVVRSTQDLRVRGRALFWLADIDDPRALALFEELLRGPS